MGDCVQTEGVGWEEEGEWDGKASGMGGWYRLFPVVTRVLALNYASSSTGPGSWSCGRAQEVSRRRHGRKAPLFVLLDYFSHLECPRVILRTKASEWYIGGAGWLWQANEKSQKLGRLARPLPIFFHERTSPNDVFVFFVTRRRHPHTIHVHPFRPSAFALNSQKKNTN